MGRMLLGCFLAAVDECASVNVLGCDECLGTRFVAVGITEDNTCEGCAIEK